MRARATTAAVLLAAGLLAAVLPASAQANIYQRVESTYERLGTVPACMFSSAQLSTTLKEVDTYGQQYFADFTNAVLAALAAQASGDCSPAVLAARARPPGASVPPDGSLPGSVTSPTRAGLPGTVVLLGALALLAGLAGGVVAVARLGGYRPRWAAVWGHALAEAGYRLSGRWQDARDLWRR